jgi:hypothetical protein
VLIGARVTVAAPEACPAPSATEARDAAKKAAGWLVANQLPTAPSGIRSTAGQRPRRLPSVRHAGATLALYQVAAVTNDERTLAAADRATAWMLDNLAENANAPTEADGTAAGRECVDARGARGRRGTGSTEHDDTMRTGVSSSRCNANGDFYVAYDPTTDRPTAPHSRSTTRAKRCGRWRGCRTPSPTTPPHLACAPRFVATERNDRDFVPVGPLNDHWAAHAFAEMAAWPIGDAEAAYARSLAGRFAALIRWEAQKDSGAPYSWTHGPTRRAAALGTWVEGQAALAHLARTDHRLADLRADTRTSAECGAGLLIARQRGGNDPRVAGAWFDSGQSRMDDEQHPITGLLGLADLLEPEKR